MAAATTTNLTIATLPRLQAANLAAMLREKNANPSQSVTVIDVRDSDHIGGHIRGSRHVPVASLDHALPELVRTLRDQDTVVFHCMLSQQRGPSAALQYARERLRMLGPEAGACRLVSGGGGAGGGADVVTGSTDKPVQMVAVLDRGFEGWQQLYGRDEALTEAYAADIWEMSD